MILERIAEFITAIVEHNPAKVIIGRTNYVNIDFNDDIILVDMLASTPLGRSNQYDPITETFSYKTLMKATITVSFFGDNALDNAIKAITMLESEEAINSARVNDITYLFPSRIQNTGRLTGSEHNEKYEIEMGVQYVYESLRSVLRVDTAQITFLNDK